MADMLAPYNDAMRLGCGFNSYTQELCIDNAVIVDEDVSRVPEPVDSSPTQPTKPSITFGFTKIDKVTGASTVKNGSLFDGGRFGESFHPDNVLNNKSSLLFSIKVVNRAVTDRTLVKFSPIRGLLQTEFAKTYGNSFISGFQEGGELHALISVSNDNKVQASNLLGSIEVSLTKAMEGLAIRFTASTVSSVHSTIDEQEIDVSVSWCGGGHQLKDPSEKWTFETLRAAAIKFPDLVIACPARIYALVTQYTELQSFQDSVPAYTPPVLDNTEGYTNILQDAYFDFKALYKNVQRLIGDVSAGLKTLKPAEVVGQSSLDELESLNTRYPAEGRAISSSERLGKLSQEIDVSQTGTRPQPQPAMAINKPYSASIVGLERARRDIRQMMTRIVSEVDLVADYPQIATDITWPVPFMSPLTFRQYLPVVDVVGDE